MKCPECGAEVYDDIKKCPFCKIPLKDTGDDKFKNFDFKYMCVSLKEAFVYILLLCNYILY